MSTTAVPLSAPSKTAPLSGTSTFGQIATLLALAVQRHRVYPSTNPVLAEALKAAHRALTALENEQVVVRVGARTLFLDQTPLAASAGIAEFAARLHQGGVASLTLFRDASLRDVACLCRELTVNEEATGGDSLPDRLKARGVEKIQAVMQLRPAVLDVGTPRPALLARLQEDQRHVNAAAHPSGRLYRPDKGWVRLDAGVSGLESVSLSRLAELVGDPFALAGMLAELADEPGVDPTDALENRFEEIALLMRSTEPAVAAALLGRLARAVLALDPDRRQALLRNTILPGLIDGRIDGELMRQFPDVDLAESLSLLLDLQVAAPELLRTALDRIDLPAERRGRVEPLLSERLLARDTEGGDTPGRIDGLTGERIRVDLSRQKEFRDFSTFDLAIDDGTAARLQEARTIIGTTRAAAERTRCLLHLLRFEANPEAAGRFLAGVLDALNALARDNELDELAGWIRELRRVEASIQESRPEIAERVAAGVSSLADDALIERLVRAADGDPGVDAPASSVVEAFGSAILGPLLAALGRETSSARRTALRRMMCANASVLAPAIAPHLLTSAPEVTRALVAVLGHAGHGYESGVGSVVGHPDVRVVRDAMRALVQIGTIEARRLVVSAMSDDGERGRLAEEAIWQFPDGRIDVCGLLERPDFALVHPSMARRLLVRAAERRRDDLAPLSRRLSRLRLRFWRPSQLQLGLAAARIGKGL